MRAHGYLAALLLAAGTACAPQDEGSQPATPAANQTAASQAMAAAARIEDLREESSPELIDMLKNGTPTERQRAALAMGRIQSAAYSEALAEAADPSEPVSLRTAALFALGQLGLAEGVTAPPEVLAAVRQAMTERDETLLAAAVQALGKLAPADAAPRLKELLQHASPKIREQAAFALFRLRFAPVWRKEQAEPPALPEDAIQGTLAALKDTDVRVRRAAAHTFSRYGEEAAAEGLAEALGDEDELVRIFAARGLEKIGDLPSTDALAEALGDPSAAVRAASLSALATLNAAEKIPLALAEDESFQVRAAAARAWAKDSRGETLEALAGLLEDPSPTVQGAAIEAFAERRGAQAAQPLREILESGPWTSRMAAARGASFLGPEALKVLERALGDSDPRVQAAAIETLADASSSTETTERIGATLASEDLAVRGTAVTALADRSHPKKIDWLEAVVERSPGVDWVEIREEAVAAILPEDGGEGLLQRLAADSAPSVARRAQAALEERGIPVETIPPTVEPGTRTSLFLGAPFTESPTVVLETEKGNLEILTLPQEAPNHVASFVQLVREGFYDGLIWHRVVPSFVIQGGDPLGNGWGGPGYALRDEIHPRPFRRGSVGMPKAGKDTGGCQIFITHIPTPHLDGNYTIFGEVTAGLEVIDAIEVGDRILRAYVRE